MVTLIPFDWDKFKAGAKLKHGDLVEVDRIAFPSRPDIVNVLWSGGHVEAINKVVLEDTRHKFQLEIEVQEVQEVVEYYNCYTNNVGNPHKTIEVPRYRNFGISTDQILKLTRAPSGRVIKVEVIEDEK